MSLVIINGVPAKMSTSKSSITRASSVRRLAASYRVRWVSPTTMSGVTPSVCKACWDVSTIGASMLRATKDLIMLVSASVSKVSLSRWC